LLRNEPAALAGEPEGIHQMRIAIRRLRSALSALKRALPMKHYHRASEELTWLAHVLGSARNWDTFTACLLPPVASALPARPEFEYVVDAAERRRRRAHEEAKQTIVSKRYTEAMLQLLRWFAVRAWRDQQLSKQAAFLLDRIVNIAPDLLEQHHRKARKRSKGFEALTATQRHKLRIALKKLQYTIEFLASLFDEDQIRPFVKRVKRLQNDLGYANDIRVAYDLMDQVGETNNHARAINRAGGIVLGWHQRILVDRDTKVRKHVRRFRRLDPFW
jgi:CHAD domain-containing protein